MIRTLWRSHLRRKALRRERNALRAAAVTPIADDIANHVSADGGARKKRQVACTVAAAVAIIVALHGFMPAWRITLLGVAFILMSMAAETPDA